MDALVRIFEDDLIVRVVSCAYDLSLPNQLIAHQSAHALRLGSIFSRQKMRMKSSRSKMIASISLSPTPFLFFQGLLLLGFVPGFQLCE